MQATSPYSKSRLPLPGGERPGERELYFALPREEEERADVWSLGGTHELAAARWGSALIRALGLPEEYGFYTLFADLLGLKGLRYDWPISTLDVYDERATSDAAVKAVLPEVVRLSPELQVARVFMHVVERSPEDLLQLWCRRSFDEAVQDALAVIERLKSGDDTIDQWAAAAGLSRFREYEKELLVCKEIADRARISALP
eukprot:Hpha_TRINITY_DN15735_c5_g1::TRINITY_DN15735_c5_g1_i5::g.41995::m.41995